MSKKKVEVEQIHPIIDRTFNFEDLNQALEYSLTGHATGKIIINF